MAGSALKHKLLSFDGRLRRQDWWLLGLLVAAVQLVFIGLAYGYLSGPGEPFLGALSITESGIAASRGWWVATGISVLGLWPQLALGVKRGHDIGWNGIWTSSVYVVSFIVGLAPVDFGTTLGAYADAGQAIFYFSLAAFAASSLLNLILLVALGFIDGKPEANRYGPSPKSADNCDDRSPTAS